MTVHQLQPHIEKVRYMGLGDLTNQLDQYKDTISRDVEQVAVPLILNSIKDSNAEVQNMAVKSLVVAVRRTSDDCTIMIVQELCKCLQEKQEGLRDISAMGLKNVMAEIVKSRMKLIDPVVNLLITNMVKMAAPKAEVLNELLDILQDVLVKATVVENPKVLYDYLLPVADSTSNRLSLRKKAVTVICAIISTDQAATEGLTKSIAADLEKIKVSNLSVIQLENIKMRFHALCLFAQGSPQFLQPHLDAIFQLVQKFYACDEEDEAVAIELKEVCCQLLELVTIHAPQLNAEQLDLIVKYAIESVKFDPNCVYDSGDEMETEFDDFEDQFEEEDDEDQTWKVRKAGVRVLKVTLHLVGGKALDQIKKEVLGCVKERNDAIRAEVHELLYLIVILNKTQLNEDYKGDNSKRRRMSFDFSAEEAGILVKATENLLAKHPQGDFKWLFRVLLKAGDSFDDNILRLLLQKKQNVHVDQLLLVKYLSKKSELKNETNDFLIAMLDDSNQDIILTTLEIVEVQFQKLSVNENVKRKVGLLIQNEVQPASVRQKAIEVLAVSGDVSHVKELVAKFVSHPALKMACFSLILQNPELLTAVPDLNLLLEELVGMLNNRSSYEKAYKKVALDLLNTILKAHNRIDGSILTKLIQYGKDNLANDSDDVFSVLTGLLKFEPALENLSHIVKLYVSQIQKHKITTSSLVFVANYYKLKQDEVAELLQVGNILSKDNYKKLAELVGVVLTSGIHPQLQQTSFNQLIDLIDDQNELVSLFAVGSIGEFGKAVDLNRPEFGAPQQKLLNLLHEAKDDNKRLEACYALGKISLSNLGVFVPSVLQLDRFYFVHALSSFLTNLTNKDAFEQYAKACYDKLVATQPENDQQIEAVSECLGKLFRFNIQLFDDYMNNHLKSDKFIIACLCALKHLVTLSKGESFDLSPQIVGFIQRSAKSNDLLLKKNAISLMNTIFHTTMQPAVLELVHVVFQELVVNEDLIKTVDLGPFKHKVDEGLECRKVSYECLFSILGQFENNTRFTNKNIIDLIFERVVLGAKDPNQEIQLLAHLIIHKTFQIKKDIIVSVHTVDTLAEAFKVQIFTQLKDNAVKQELEKQSELVKSCIKLVIDLSLYLNVARIEPTKQGIASLDYSSAKYASLVELLKEISTNQKSASTLEQVLIEESHHQHHY